MVGASFEIATAGHPAKRALSRNEESRREPVRLRLLAFVPVSAAAGAQRRSWLVLEEDM